MALHAPVPSYPAILTPSSPSSSSTSPSPLVRHVSRSERMLIAALRRADQQQQQQMRQDQLPPSSSNESDYFSRTVAYSTSNPGYNTTTGAPSSSRSPSKQAAQSLFTPQDESMTPARSPSPLAQRVVDRERIARRRTPSPSPHPYRPASPRTVTAPHLSRHQTAPNVHQAAIIKSGQTPSRPGTPSREINYGHPTSSSSPVRPYASSRAHSRRESGPALGVSPTTKMSAHEQYLRARLEGVLAASSNHMDVCPPVAASSSATGPAKPASRTVPMVQAATVSGDQWSWSNSQAASTPALHLAGSVSPPTGKLAMRSPSSSHLAVTSPARGVRANSASNAMITPPPSPPYRGPSGAPHLSAAGSPAASTAPSRAQSQVRSALGHGHPSRASSKAPTTIGSVTPEERVTPPPQPCPAFDARQASLALKHQAGYVSFCEVAGLGEPEGMFDDEKDDGADGKDDGEEKRGRWWEVWRK